MTTPAPAAAGRGADQTETTEAVETVEATGTATRRRPLLPLSAGHFCVDSYAGMLPLLQERLGLSLAATATIGAVMAFSNLSQPLFGLLGDRLRRRNLVPAGLLLAAACMPLMGITASFALTIAVIAAGGLGVAAFHPQSFVIAADLSGARRAFGIALFVFAGTVGLAITPTWLTFTVDAFGTRVLPLAALPGVVAALAIWRWVPLAADPAQDQGWRAVGAQLTASLRPLAAILSVVVLRNVTFLGFNLFIAILNRDRGMSLAAGGIALSVYSLAGVLASLGVGTGRRPYRSEAAGLGFAGGCRTVPVCLRAGAGAGVAAVAGSGRRPARLQHVGDGGACPAGGSGTARAGLQPAAGDELGPRQPHPAAARLVRRPRQRHRDAYRPRLAAADRRRHRVSFPAPQPALMRRYAVAVSGAIGSESKGRPPCRG